MIFVMPDPDNTFDIDEVLGGIQKRLSGFGFEDHYYFQMINDVAVAEDYSLVDKINRGLKAGIERKLLIGRNEPGVQNMHRQLHDVLG